MNTRGENTYCDFSVRPPVWCASGTQVHTSHVIGHFCPVLFGPGCQRTAAQTAVEREGKQSATISMHTNSLLCTTQISGIPSNTLIFIQILREFSLSSKLFLPIWTCPQHRSDVCPQYKAGTSEKVQKTSSLKTTHQKSLFTSYGIVTVVYTDSYSFGNF